MNVSSVNSVAFGGKIKETKNGNQYEKSNIGKIFIPLISLSVTSISLLNKKSQGVIYQNFSKEVGEIAKVTKSSKAAVVVNVALRFASMLTIGAIFDGIINKKRRKNADKFAEKKEVPEKTNKGKIVCSAISLGLFGVMYSLTSALNKLNKVSKESPKGYNKMPGFSTFALGMTTWLLYGTVYDHGVNKFSDKLASNALRDKALEKRLDSKIDEKVQEKLKEMAVKKD